jgi:large subunit ribosomal protein L14e
MPAVEIGRICIKTHGRESGKECVIVDIIDKSFVLITGPQSVSGVKRRRVNLSHLEPTDTVLDINRGSTDEEVEKALIEMKKN